MLNTKNRKATNEEYLNFIRRLPCVVTGKCGVQAHHTDVIGRQGIRNDYYAVPLNAQIHVGGGHITEFELEHKAKETIGEMVIFYLSLYAEWKTGLYDLEADESCNFLTLRRKKEGLE